MRRIVFLGFALLFSAALAQVNMERGISVSGQGTVYGEPDIAVFEVGVNFMNADLTVATRQANEAMSRLMTALLAEEIDPKDIRTINYNIWIEDRYDRAGEPQEPRYRVMNVVRVVVRDVERAGELLGLSVESGANVVNNIQFTISNPEALERQARERAIASARDRAEQLARLSGVSLGAVQRISESQSYAGPSPVPYRAMMESASAPPIAGGELAITISVQVNFAIE